jgi:hypothetical protein
LNPSGGNMSGQILSEEDWKAIRDVSRSLRFFAENKMYTYIDRLGDAFSSMTAIEALKDALRILRSEGNLYLPSETSVKRVIELIKTNKEVSGIIAALALSYPSRKEGGGKVVQKPD